MGLDSWKHATNHNAMAARQGTTPQDKSAQDTGAQAAGPVMLAYYGASAFCLTTPSGLTVMIDPWRNHPAGGKDWFYHDFPLTKVDIGVSTHAHFDHDALHRLDASVMLDRLIGCYEFADLRLTGIADKHAIEDAAAPYDMHRLNRYFGGANLAPPDNARSWDNCLLMIETGGLRILHWGDNRHNPPQQVWDQIGQVDVLIVPIDGSQHVLSDDHVERVIARLKPSLIVPCHYYIWNVHKQHSTLLPADQWVQQREQVVSAPADGIALRPDPAAPAVLDFGQSVAFDVDAWHRDNGCDVVPET
ncbi:MAG: MBL fold metallo-hydrolase [Thalassovita sp.]